MAQQIECGTPDIPLTQMADFLAEIDTSATGTIASNSLAASGLWKIGVWFYHLRYADGTSDHQESDPELLIGEINTFFGGLFEFHICGVTNIDNDDYAQLDIGNTSPDLTNLWNDIESLNEPWSDKCVRVFLLGHKGAVYENGLAAGTGYTHEPLRYAKPAVFLAEFVAKTWAHEAGHYFGLPHTFMDPPTQYVHDINTPVVINGISYTCEQTGDGFCDTEADPRYCGFNGQCELVKCPQPNDPLGVPYNPDPTLLMSYYKDPCRYRFTDQQRQRMRTLYDSHPDYAFLKQPPEECIGIKYGHIKRNCSGYVLLDPIEPLVGVPVQVRGDAQPYCDPQDNKTDISGNYLTIPCPITGTIRKVLPDRNFGNDPLNGVSTFDLVRINKHILGVELFENPFQYIAADVNNSATITTLDIIEIKKLILGITAELPGDISWRYVPKICTESSGFWLQFDANPFTAEFTDPFQGFIRKYKSTASGLVVPNQDSWMDFVNLVTTSEFSNSEAAWSFTGVKLGDVNCNAITEGDPFRGEDHDFLLDAEAPATIYPTSVKRIQVVGSAPAEVVAWQFGIRYAADSLTLGGLAPGTDATLFDEDNFYLNPLDTFYSNGTLRAIWFSPQGEPVIINDKVLFEFQVTGTTTPVELDEALRLNNEVLPFLFYDQYGDTVPNVNLTLRILNMPQGFQSPVLSGAKPDLNGNTRVQAYPVPFVSDVEFRIELPAEEEITLDVFSGTGSLIYSVQQRLPAGVSELQISDLASYPAGFFWYSLRAGAATIRGKICKR